MLHNSYFMYVPRYNDPVFYSGICFFMLPFFLFGHLMAYLLQAFPSVFINGYSWPYTITTSLSGVFAGLAVIIILFYLCRHFFGQLSSLLAVLLVFWAGNLVFYTFVWPLYSHIFSVLAISLFILCWLKKRETIDPIYWLIWGVLFGMAVMIRPQNILYGFIPLYELIRLLAKRQQSWGQIIKCGCAFGLASLICFSPQLFLWYTSSGHIILDTYGQKGDEFYWLNPRFLQPLFSMHKGLFIWTPVFVFCLPGFAFFLKKNRELAFILFLSFFLQWYLISCYEFPIGNPGYGCRYLINCMPFFTICLAGCIQWIYRKTNAVYIVIIGSLLVFFNLILMGIYHLDHIPDSKYVPTFQGLLEMIFSTFPAKMSEYIFLPYINENIFARMVFTAIGSNSLHNIVIALVLFFCIAFLLTYMIYGLHSFLPCEKKTLAWFLGSMFIIIMLLNIAVISLKKGPYYTHVYPIFKTLYTRPDPPALSTTEFSLNAINQKQDIDINYSHPVQIIDITTTTIHGFTIPPSTPIATMTVIDHHNDTHHFNIIYELHTSEYSTFRKALPDDAIPKIIPKNKAIHHWLSMDAGGYYYGTGYHQRFMLPSERLVKKMVFEYIYPEGTIIVNGIHLANKLDGGQ